VVSQGKNRFKPFTLVLLILLLGLLLLPSLPIPANKQGSQAYSEPSGKDCKIADAETEKARLLGRTSERDANSATNRWKCASAKLRQAKAEGGAPAPSVRPAGDLCGMRYTGYYDGLDRSIYRRFAIIAFSNDPNYQLQALLELQQGNMNEPRIAYRAALARVYVALRANRLNDAIVSLQDAGRWDAEAAEMCRADLFFLRGVIAERKGDSREALANYYDAIALDENFWNANSRLIAVLYQRLISPLKNTASCLDTTRLFLTRLRKMQSLGQNRTQFINLAEALAAKGGADSPAANLVLAHIYAWNKAPKEMQYFSQRVISSTTALPAPCQDLLKKQALALAQQES